MYKKIGIICASTEELAPFLPHIENDRTSEKAMLCVHEGSIAGVPVAALFCGVCKVNAALAAQMLIDNYGVDLIINAGTAGGIDRSITVFDVVAGSSVAYHDVAEGVLTQFHPWKKSVWFDTAPELLEAVRKAGEKTGKDIHIGRMVTGEAFITDEGREHIKENFAPLSVDMETTAMAHVCFANKIDFIAVRVITDTEDCKGLGSFELNLRHASKISAEVTIALLEVLREA